MKIIVLMVIGNGFGFSTEFFDPSACNKEKNSLLESVPELRYVECAPKRLVKVQKSWEK